MITKRFADLLIAALWTALAFLLITSTFIILGLIAVDHALPFYVGF